MVVATDGQLSFVTFLYDDIQWSDDDAVAGIYRDDAPPAVVLIPGSDFDARILTTTSNVGVPGMWMYRVDSPDIIMPPADFPSTNHCDVSSLHTCLSVCL